MLNRIASIAKPYVQRVKKAMRKTIAFVKRNKNLALAAAGVTAVVAVRALTNTKKDADWVRDACDLVQNGDANFLLASHSETGASVLFAPVEVVERSLAEYYDTNDKL